ncbi:hypothetical protein BBJ28_00011629 [Nothophytophthora sp. Chile5]|nr:hypothetical protein BBJ28_00011629 [Nothophytophthora sp. Chile5]
MMGVSKAILDSVIFCHQEEANWPLQEGAVLKKRFDDIFESARYTKALEAIRKLKKARNDDTKDYKRDLAVLTVNMKTAEDIRDKIESAEDTLRAVSEEREKAGDAVVQAEETLEEMEKLQSEIEGHHNALERQQCDVAQKEATIKNAYAKIEQMMSDTDEELETLLNNYDAIIEEHRKGFAGLQSQESQLAVEQSTAQKRYEKLCISKGSLEARIQGNQQLVTELIALAGKFGSTYGFHMKPLSSQEDDISAFLMAFQDVVGAKRTALNRLERQQQEEDDALASVVSELNAKLHHSKEEVKAKAMELGAINKDKRATASRLKDLSMGGIPTQRDVAELVTRTTEAEGALKAYKEQHDTRALKDEIKRSNRKVTEANYAIDDLGSKINQLRLHEDEYISLNAKRADYRSKLERFQTKLAERATEFQEALEGEVPTDRASVITAFNRIGNLVAERKRFCGEKKKELESAEKLLQENVVSARLASKSVTSLRQEKSELERQQVGELKKLLEEVLPGQDLRNAEHGLQKAEQAYFEAKDKTVRRKNMVMFLNIYKKKGVKEHCCPLCERDMSPEEEQAFVSIVNDKTDDKKVEDKIKKAEALEATMFKTWKGVEAKMPSWRKWMALETTIPQKDEELDRISAEQKSLQSDVADKKAAYELAQGQLEETERAKRELGSLSEVADELHSTSLRIEADASRLDSAMVETLGTNAPSLKDVQAEKDAKQAEVQELNRQLQRMQTELQHLSDMQQQLQTDLFKRQEEKLKLETQRKEYDDAISEQNRLREQEKAVREASTKLTNAEPVLEREVRTKMSEHIAHRSEANKTMKAQRLELDQEQGDLRIFSDKCKKIQSGDHEKLERELQKLSEEIAQTKQRQTAAARALEDLSPQMKSARENLDKKETYKRQIRDNLDYRGLQKELNAMRVEGKNIKRKIEALPALDDVEQRVHSSKRTVDAARESRAELKGKKDQLHEHIREFKVQLRGANLKDVEEKYRQKLIQFETTQLAVADLERYYKALDQSLLLYHSKKVEEINTIIRSLWQITYKGQDIDTIELVSGQQNGATSKAARSYDYRVVMKKAGASIDMRGRCSAGQKVLAALVIRLALAETFCLNCGILALDEPTTNLDTENNILNARSQQQNFQLVCITHDEEFVQMLSRTQAMDGVRPEFYWRISREDMYDPDFGLYAIIFVPSSDVCACTYMHAGI